MYSNNKGVWTQIGDAMNGRIGFDLFGYGVALSSDGSVVAIGVSGFFGQVCLYKNMLNIWTQIGDDIDGEGTIHSQGSSVALSSDESVLAIGAFDGLLESSSYSR